MAYNKKLDEVLFEESIDAGEFKLIVEVHRYNKGEPKIQLSRMQNEGYLRFGRITLDEINAILPLIERAKEKMVVGEESPTPPAK